jgi:hypothetical protein
MEGQVLVLIVPCTKGTGKEQPVSELPCTKEMLTAKWNCGSRPYLGAKLLNLRSQFLALLGVLPLGCLLALDNLQQVQMFLFQFLFLEKQLVEAGNTTARNVRNGTLSRGLD